MAPHRHDEPIGRLYDRVGARLAAVVTGKSGVPHDVAADAVQEVFIDLLEKDAVATRVLALTDPEAFRYLLTAAVHRAGRELARRAAIEARPIETIDALLARQGLTARPQPLETVQLIQHALGRLRSPYREVLAGLLVKRQSARQLAAELNRPVNTIYQQTHRGLQLLREDLNRELVR